MALRIVKTTVLINRVRSKATNTATEIITTALVHCRPRMSQTWRAYFQAKSPMEMAMAAIGTASAREYVPRISAPQYQDEVPTKISSGYRIAPPMQVRQLTERPRPAQKEFSGVILPGSRRLKQGWRMTWARFGETRPTTAAIPTRILRPNLFSHKKQVALRLKSPSDFKANKTRNAAPR